jgi:hypothetical protein
MPKAVPATTTITKIPAYTFAQFGLPSVAPNAVIQYQGVYMRAFVVQEKHRRTRKDVLNVYTLHYDGYSPTDEPQVQYDPETKAWTEYMGGTKIKPVKVSSMKQWYTYVANRERL